MKINELRQALLATSEMLSVGGSALTSADLRQFAEALVSPKPSRVADVVEKITSEWATTCRVPAYPKSLRDLLAKIEIVQLAFGAKAAATDIGLLLKLFHGNQDQDIGTFCADIGDGLAVAAKPVKSRASTTKAQPITAAEVRELADKLIALADDHASFDSMLAALKNRKVISKPVMCEIANRFLGYETKFKSRDAALEAIRRRQLQDAIQGARAREVQKIAV